MKVSMLRNPADSFGCKLTEGEAGEVPDAIGSKLIASGVAVRIDEPEGIKAVPESPSIAKASDATSKPRQGPQKSKSSAK